MSPAAGQVNHAILRVSSIVVRFRFSGWLKFFGRRDMSAFVSPGGTIRPARFQIGGLHGHVCSEINSYSVPVDMMRFKVIALFVLHNWPWNGMWLSEPFPVVESLGAR